MNHPAIPNPIIPGFAPDTQIYREGEDYYAAFSSFEYFPGLPIYHSRDLIHWEIFSPAWHRPEQFDLHDYGCSDALAGTAPVGPNAGQLLNSDKDRREHELVVEAITEVLHHNGLTPRRPRHPRLARHGQLVHLHTPITAALGDQQPLALAAALHPTPAVAGLPRREAMAALRSLEPFERGYYAAPIGWIDSEGDTELRVAIRSGSLQGQRLELTAGAGLVPGSAVDRELAEVALKLGVLQQQLDLPRLNTNNASP